MKRCRSDGGADVVQRRFRGCAGMQVQMRCRCGDVEMWRDKEVKRQRSGGVMR